ncbi:Na(+)/H(+) antiporter subunit C [Microbacterium oleivorans]|uniref:Multisubunit Na+/H+ antiporter MrpC subunit n=1 Tax=Microbacterium oleivorans TaxID=273677 RepID=A0A031FST4_9MICO|nr:Na(+)/H(+) antiporter subunit C [Microbacterium oleivorans]AZS42508.1 Na(+)/H(+) antiporter subunit C [Microbacterium oleivorans]EZP27648.1 Multisubunit Na+/H+ antiporter MrpC subunit [Microbacterium oleivorans]THE08501.1 Na(+)/H(+) antiporter subunit C [Microbacterium oleivorans]
MTVSLVLVIIMGALFAAGVYAMLERSLTRVLIGFLLLGNAANLFLLVVMGAPGIAPFSGSAEDGERFSDPLPQALSLTAIVITFAISSFLLALIYRSWQLGQADTVADDEADREVRERGARDEETMDDEITDEDDDATTDFIGTETSPIVILHAQDIAELRDDAGLDRPGGQR